MRLATDAQDNHLRALILALLSSYFVHTAPDHAIKMLEAAEVLGSGMGAKPKADKKDNASPAKTDDARASDAIGNGPLRIWVGEKFLGKSSDSTPRITTKLSPTQRFPNVPYHSLMILYMSKRTNAGSQNKKLLTSR